MSDTATWIYLVSIVTVVTVYLIHERLKTGQVKSKEGSMRGAGGSEGGLGRFLIGLVMLVGGGYMFFNSIRVTHGFTIGRPFLHVGGFGINSGMVLIPFIFGIGIIFYNSRNIIGWVLCGSSLVMLGFGVISTISFRFQRMSAFDLIVILTLFVGGLGLFLSSLRTLKREADAQDRRDFERRSRHL